MTPTLTTKTPDHPTMTHFTQNTPATTTQTLTSKRINSINQGTYLTPSTHTTTKTGRTQIRSNNLPTQTPGGHHTQITPHPKRPSETHTPHPKQKNTPPTSPTPHTTPNTPKTQPQPLTPTNNTTRQPHPTPYTHAHKRSPHPTDTQPPNTQHTQALLATQRLHSLTLTQPTPGSTLHPLGNTHPPCTPRQGVHTPGPPGDPTHGDHMPTGPPTTAATS